MHVFYTLRVHDSMTVAKGIHYFRLFIWRVGLEKKGRERTPPSLLLESAEFCHILPFFKLAWVSDREFSRILSIAK